MAEYDDFGMASDEQTEAMNREYAEVNAKKARKEASGRLPVYLTDEAHRAAESCYCAAQGCIYLLDYATSADEKKLLGYAADAMNGLCSALGGGRKISSAERFGASGVRRALRGTFLLCNEAAMKICLLAEASGEDSFFDKAARTALCAAQSVMTVYLLQI